MTNKYYAPELSEFYAGFEYEEFNKYQEHWTNHILSKEDFESLGSFMYNFLENLESGNIRVKYLDKQDLEDCGFELLKDKCPFGQLQFYKKVEDGFNCGYELIIRIGEFYGNNARFIEIEKQNYSHYENAHYKIRPIVNNLNEFKKLLKQLGI